MMADAAAQPPRGPTPALGQTAARRPNRLRRPAARGPSGDLAERVEFRIERAAVSHAARNAAGGLRLHDLWHSYATWLVSRGVPINDVQRAMGHERASVTSTGTPTPRTTVTSWSALPSLTTRCWMTVLVPEHPLQSALPGGGDQRQDMLARRTPGVLDEAPAQRVVLVVPGPRQQEGETFGLGRGPPIRTLNRRGSALCVIGSRRLLSTL
jgi:Phage integrase family